MTLRPLVLVLFAFLASACGSTTAQIRIHNASTLDYTEVSVAGTSFGNIAAGETSDYRDVTLRSRYASLELRANGKRVTGQTLNTGSKRFTYRIDVLDLEKGHLAIDVEGE